MTGTDAQIQYAFQTKINEQQDKVTYLDTITNNQ